MGWFPEAYAEPASNPVKVEKPAAVAEAKESNQYVALFPYNSEGLFMFYMYLFRNNNYEDGCHQNCLQGLPLGIDIMYLVLADTNIQVRLGLKVFWES